jgi:hypothetical protein
MPTTNHQYTGAFAPGVYFPVFDATGTLVANKVTDELHTITAENGKDYHVVVPLFAPFFINNLVITFKQNGASVFIPLTEGVDYLLAYHFLGASRGCAKAVYGGISFINNQLAGIVKLQYQTIGGNWTLSQASLNSLLANQLQNPRTTSWEQIVQLPEVFPVIDHEWNLKDLIGASHIVEAIEQIGNNLSSTSTANADAALVIVQDHSNDKNNPHQTTKTQVGLGNVENYAVANTAQARDSTNTNTYMTPQKTHLVVSDHEAKTDPHPQYATDAEVQAIIASTGFKGSYVGTATLSANAYAVTMTGVTVTNGLFSIKFASENPASATLTINGVTKPLVNEEGNPIEAKEIVANQIRTLVNNSTAYVVLGSMKYISLPFSSSTFTSINQNEAVRFSNGGLVKAIADNTSPNNNVVGFADKDSNRVVYSGILSGFTGLETDAIYYLSSTTAGAITKTKPPLDSIRVGIAKSATELFVSIMAAASNDTVPTGGVNNGLVDKIFYLDSKIITANYLIPADKNAMSVGPLTVDTGVEVEIPSGSVWTIV